MKGKWMLMFAMIIGSIVNVMAQPAKEKKQEKREEIKAMKIAFITEKLSLTSEEAQKFWPVYNDFHDKLEKLHKERKANHKAVKKGIDSLSNAELEKKVDLELQFEEKELALKKDFHTKVKTVLPIKKVALLYEAEHEFRKEILKKARDQKGPGNGQHNPPPPPPGGPEDDE